MTKLIWKCSNCGKITPRDAVTEQLHELHYEVNSFSLCDGKWEKTEIEVQ